jgi:uncharacterized membrane protein
MGLILLILLICLIVFALPAWPYSRGWGYGPMGLISLILIVLLVLLLANVIVFWKVKVDTDDDQTTIKIEKQEY